MLLPALTLLAALFSATESEDAVKRLLPRLPKGPVAISWQNLTAMPAEETDRAKDETVLPAREDKRKP